MATHVLQSDTLLSSLLPSGGGSLASGDTIDFNGHTLVMDCDAVDFPFTPTNAGGERCKLELRDLSRIKLNASLPSTVRPWVDPEHPLPVSAEPGIDGDPFRTPLTANARAEIQLNGNFALGGGAASLPTMIRSAGWHSQSASYPSASSVVLADSVNIHVGDYLVDFSSNTNAALLVTAVDGTTISLGGNISTRTTGSQCVVAGGGVCVRRVNSTGADALFNADISFGALTVFGNSSSTTCFKCNAMGTRLVHRQTISGNPTGLLLGAKACLYCRDLAVQYAFAYNTDQTEIRIVADTAIGIIANLQSTKYWTGAVVSIKKLFGLFDVSGVRSSFSFGEGSSLVRIQVLDKTSKAIVGDATIINNGTATRTARTDFPTDTDLPDAQYHAPNASNSVTWRYEDRWVRKGETLRMRARWMPAGAASMANVAVTSTATWWPDLWPLGVAALASTEFPPGLEQLHWHDRSVEWRNATGEDCQVRVWECVTGDTLGGYLRVWQATGGAM